MSSQDRDGNQVNPWDPGCTQHCAAGSVWAQCYKDNRRTEIRFDSEDLALNVLDYMAGGDIIEYNDNMGHVAVLNVMSAAISRLERLSLEVDTDG